MLYNAPRTREKFEKNFSKELYGLALTPESRRVLLADAVLVLVAFIWGLGIPISADMVRTLSPLWSTALRMIVAGVSVVSIYFPRVRSAARAEWRSGLIMASFVSSVFILMSFALIYSTSSKQAFIIGMAVLMVPFMAWGINRERPHRCVFIGAALGTLGMLIMGFSPGMRFNFGDALNLVMCFLWAGQVLVIEYLVRRVDPTTLVALQLPLVAVILTAAALIAEGPIDLGAIQPRIWAEIVFTGLANTVLCFILQTRAQKNTSASHAAIIMALESVFGYLISVVSGQDPFIFQGAVGGTIIMCGVFVSELETILAPKEPAVRR
jgi:drug/metabolite transporter (DMT)-like permease